MKKDEHNSLEKLDSIWKNLNDPKFNPINQSYPVQNLILTRDTLQIKPSTDSSSIINNVRPVIILQQQYLCLFKQERTDKIKKSYRNVLKIRSRKIHMRQNEIISYLAFMTKVEPLFQFSHQIHSLRLLAWMHLYIKITNPEFKLKIHQLKTYHKQIKKIYKNVQSIVAWAQENLQPNNQNFKNLILNFDQIFPQLQAIFQSFHIQNLSSKYQQNCQIAKDFFSNLTLTITKSPETLRKLQWTRLQYLTYTAFLLLRQGKINYNDKDRFDDLAEYSFEGDFHKLWKRYHYYFNVMKSSNKIQQMLIKQWKLPNQAISNQKNKLHFYLQEKQHHGKQKKSGKTMFQQFLSQQKLIKLKSQCKIQTDNFEITSKIIECFIFQNKNKANKGEADQFSKRKKNMHYQIYMIIGFELNSQELAELKNLRQVFSPLLNSNHKENLQLSLQINPQVQKLVFGQIIRTNKNTSQNKQGNFSCEKKNPFNQQPIQLQETSQVLNIGKEYFNKLKVSNFNEIQLENQEQNHPIRNNDLGLIGLIQQCQNEIRFDKFIEEDHIYLQIKENQQIPQQIQQQKFQGSSFFNHHITTNQQASNLIISHHDKNFPINFQIPAQNQKLYIIPLENQRQKTTNQNFQQFEEEINSEESLSNEENQYQDFEKQANGLYTNHYSQQDVLPESLDEFVQTLVSPQEYRIFHSLFYRKALEFKLINDWIANKGEKGVNKNQGKMPNWQFKENLKFVSFLIVNKFLFQSATSLPQNIYQVMSQLVGSRGSIQCKHHYHQQKEYSPNINEVIKNAIIKFKLPLHQLRKQVNLQKEQYFQLKGSIMQSKKQHRIYLKKLELDKQDDIQCSIVEQIDKNQLCFNLRTDYLLSKDQFKCQRERDKQIVKAISSIEKERYIKCMKELYEKCKVISKQKILQYAYVIFKQRQHDQQVPLLQKYHAILMRKYRSGQKIIEALIRQKGDRLSNCKGKEEAKKQQNHSFFAHISQRIQKINGHLEIQMLQNVIILI